MKQLILTGLATEQTFDSPAAKYYLVFNEGELRVPVSEQAAEVVVKEMFGNSEPTDDDDDYLETQPQEPPVNDTAYTSNDDDGVDQI